MHGKIHTRERVTVAEFLLSEVLIRTRFATHSWIQISLGSGAACGRWSWFLLRFGVLWTSFRCTYARPHNCSHRNTHTRTRTSLNFGVTYA